MAGAAFSSPARSGSATTCAADYAMRLKGRAGERTSSGTPSTRYVSIVPDAAGSLIDRFICNSVFGDEQAAVDTDRLADAIGEPARCKRAHGGRHFLRRAPTLDRGEPLLDLRVVARARRRRHF